MRYLKERHPFQLSKLIVRDTETDNIFDISKFKELVKVEELSKMIKNIAENKIKEFNSTYGVDFRSLGSIQAFSEWTDYPYHSQLKDLKNWVLLLYSYGRNYERSVKNGELSFSENDFLANIPKYIISSKRSVKNER